jgi:hypothetical protein
MIDGENFMKLWKTRIVARVDAINVIPQGEAQQAWLGFAPPRRDGKVREIDVRVGQRGLKPRAPKSHVALKS